MGSTAVVRSEEKFKIFGELYEKKRYFIFDSNNYFVIPFFRNCDNWYYPKGIILFDDMCSCCFVIFYCVRIFFSSKY